MTETEEVQNDVLTQKFLILRSMIPWDPPKIIIRAVISHQNYAG